MNIQNTLQEQIGFTNNEKVIAEYILKHKDDVLQMSIQELAKRTYTSTSAIMRLCNRMQLSGFKEFKYEFSQDVLRDEDGDQLVDVNFPFKRNDSISKISQQLKKLTVQTIQETQKLVSVNDIKKVCYQMKESEHVAIFGVGDAYLAGLSFQASLTRAGINFLSTPVYGEQNALASTLRRKDCALVLSYSGASLPTLEVVKYLKKNNVPIVCITANAQSPLAKAGDIVLKLPAREDRAHRIAAFFSRTAMEYYLNIIYSYLYVLYSSEE